MRESGIFVALEGPDGSGKSSMIAEIRRHLTARGKTATFAQDPGGTPIGQQIRKVLLAPENRAMCPLTELLLYVASRSQLVAEVIEPALARGELVIADRYYLSTLVYQGVAGAVPEPVLRQVVTLGINNIMPDHIILLDVPAEVGLSRLQRERDRVEEKGLIFFEEVRRRYLEFVDALPPEPPPSRVVDLVSHRAHQTKASHPQCHVVDASRSILEVTKSVLDLIDEIC
jgi:dTMP kinase